MNGLLDHFLVGVVLLAGFGYAIYSMGPKSLRGRVWLGIAAVMRRLPAFLGLSGVAGRLAATAAAKSKSACGGCDNCGSESPTAGSAQASVNVEVRVPVSTIGKRPRG